MRRLAPRPLEAAAFAPYGDVIDAAGRSFELINEGTTRRYAELARLDLRDPVAGIYEARARAFPLVIATLERHREAAQVFVPLGGQRFVVVVAPGGETPDAHAAAAFVTAPGQGIALARGCWHHGLVALGDGDRFLVLEGAGYRRDTEESALAEPLELTAP